MALEPGVSGAGRATVTAARLHEVAASFGGGVHVAAAQAPLTGNVAVAAGFSPGAARTRVAGRAAVLDAIYEVPDHPGGLAGGRELLLGDFITDPPGTHLLDTPAARVAGIGMLSRERYLVPAEVVRLDDRSGRIEPTTVGLVDGHREDAPADEEATTGTAVADLMAHDVFARWWTDPRVPLLRVSAHLPSLLSPDLVSSLALLEVWVSAFVIPGPDFRLAVVGVDGNGGTIATAGARSVRDAVREAFLQAVAARAQPWEMLLAADSLRRFTVWHRAADYLTFLESAAVEADELFVNEPPARAPAGWAEMAFRRFGHEPIMIVLEPTGEPVKIVCPGAACYRSTPRGGLLPCPVP